MKWALRGGLLTVWFWAAARAAKDNAEIAAAKRILNRVSSLIEMNNTQEGRCGYERMKVEEEGVVGVVGWVYKPPPPSISPAPPPPWKQASKPCEK